MPLGTKIDSNKFEMRVKERALLKQQGNAKYHAGLENNFKKWENCMDRIGPNEGVVDNLIGTIKRRMQRWMLLDSARPNTAELEHEGDINRRGLERAERHDIPSIFNVIGTIESKLINGVVSHNNLVEAGTSVQIDEMELAIMGVKILNGSGARGEGDFEGEGERIELAI